MGRAEYGLLEIIKNLMAALGPPSNFALIM